MKKLGLWLMTILAVILSFALVACSSGNVTKDEITLNETAITLEVGETHTLVATTNVSEVEWTSSDDAIATVKGGVVNALSAGSATITARAGSATATCTVTVEAAPEFAELFVDKTVVELREGGAGISVAATFTVNDEALDCQFVWTSENEEIATVQNGKIFPVGVGSTLVTVSVEYNGETYAADVNVEVKPDEQIQVSKGTIELELAEINGAILSDTFTAVAYKAGVENTEAVLTYVSSDENVAIVTAEAGVATVTSVGEGTCTISVSYLSAQGKIESLVNVIVRRSTIELNATIEIPYVAGNTVLDLSGIELQGDLEGVYCENEKIAAADGVIDEAFALKNKGALVSVEVRTNIAIYKVDMLIAIPYVAQPQQEVSSGVSADMSAYDGSATMLGFPAGTEAAYEIEIDEGNGKDGWANRMIVNVAPDKDVFVFDVIVTEVASLDFRFTVWPAKNTFETQGSYGVNASSTAPSGDADWSRKIFVLDADNRRPTAYAPNTLYTVYVYVNKGESHVHFSMFTDGTMYVANFRCIDADEVKNDPTLPPPTISQGESRNPMPTYEGDVALLGFEDGTTVYEIVGPQSNATDVKLVAQVDASGNNAYAKLDFVLSAPTSSLGLWITAKSVHLGYYTLMPTSFTTTDGHGDPSREIFITDANGNPIQSFEANKIYTLYVGLDGREATIQFTTWAALTIYVANYDCITVDELPNAPETPTQPEGESISILFIGNSFSDDTEAYMVDILLSLGYTDINIGNLYIGGCSIDTHYVNILNGLNEYDFRMRSHNGIKYTEYETVTVGDEKRSLDFAITYKNWDIISVQQASGYSGIASSYNNLDALVNEVLARATNPDVEIVFNMTWAYQQNSTHAQFPDYDSDQMTMYNAIVAATQEKVKYTVVPNGTAIQNARTSLLGDNLTRDGYHLDLKIGRYIVGLTFVAKVTGKDVSNITYAPNGVTKLQLAIAIESALNAIETPFEITESQYKTEPVDNQDVFAGGSNKNAVTVYIGDETALGFAEDTIVYEYTGIDSSSDKASIKVDSSSYDYVEVQFVIKQGSGYFFMHGFSNGNWYNNGVSYIIDPGWIRLGDGNNTPSDRKIEIFDAEGNQVTSLMENNVLYTLRVFTKVGDLDEISISMGGSIIYFANVKQGLESDLPVVIEGPIKQGEASKSLKIYEGDVTALGFAEGDLVQYMVTEDMANAWGTETGSGKTREQLAARIPGETGKYVTVKFVTTKDIASGSVFYVWGLLGSSHTLNGGLNFTTTTYGRILDVDGYPVTSISKNTVYVLELYIPATDTYKVANICNTGMELYFAANSITYADASMEVPLPDDDSPITAGGENLSAVTVYDGDETALGFASGSVVYKYVGTDSTKDKVAIKVDSKNYDYVEVQFVIAEGPGYFFLFGLNDGNWYMNGVSYIIDPGWIRLGDGNNTPSDRTIEILDAQGNKVTSLMENNVLYTLRVFTKLGDLDEIRIGQSGAVIYFANVTQGLESDISDPEPDTPTPDEPDEPTQAPILSAEANSTALSVYEGSATELGFAEGTTVYQLISGSSSWDDRVKIAANPKYKYLDVQFVVSSGSWSFNVWIVNANGMLDGSYIVAEQAGDMQHAIFGEGFAKHFVNNGGAGGMTRIQVLDADGNVVVGARSNGTVYTLRIWLAEEEVTQVQIGQADTTIYFGEIGCTNTEIENPIKQGDDRTTLDYYTGDVTALGFEAGTIVQQLVGKVESGWGEAIYSERAVIVADGSQDYIAVDFILATDYSGSTLFHIWPTTGAGAFKMDGTTSVSTASVTIVDKNGLAVTAIEKGKIYTLRVYDPNAKHLAIGVYGLNTIYFANVVYGKGTPAAPIVPSVTAAGTNKNAVSIYEGDETALGFAAGSTVYKYVGETSNDKLSIKVDSVNYDYVDVQVVFDAVSTKTYVLGFVMSGTSYLNGADAYILAGDNIRFNAHPNNPLDRQIMFLDADGNVVKSALQTGVVYTLRVYIKANNVTEIQMRQVGVTMYLANVTHGNDEVIVEPEPEGPVAVDIKVGDDKADPTMFDGDETMYGFAAGTDVVVMVLEAATDVDDKRLALSVNAAKDYLSIDFSLEFGLLGNIYVWTVTDGGERVLAATILADGGIDAGALVDVIIKDSAGNDVTNEVLVGLDSGAAEKYTLYVHYNGANEVHIGCDDFDEEFGGNILYFADAKCDNVEV